MANEYEGFKTVKSIAEELGVSGSRISQLIAKLDIADKLPKVGNSKMVSPEYVDMIKEAMNYSESAKPNQDNMISKDKADLEKANELNKQLLSQINDLKADKDNLQNTINGLTTANINASDLIKQQGDMIKRLETTPINSDDNQFRSSLDKDEKRSWVSKLFG